MENPSDSLHQIKTKICQKMWINCICHPLYPHTPTYWTTTSSSIYHHKGLVSMASRINLWNISQTEKFESLNRIRLFTILFMNDPPQQHSSTPCSYHPRVDVTVRVLGHPQLFHFCVATQTSSASCPVLNSGPRFSVTSQYSWLAIRFIMG